MSEPFLAEVRIFGFNFAPRGWAFCNGQILPINQNQSLYSLLGTTYGGDGRTSFALPDLRGRTPIHVGASPGGSNHTLGSKGGQENQALTVAELPTHTHGMIGTSATANAPGPGNNLLAQTSTGVAEIYSSGPSALNQQANSGAIGNQGGGQGHENMQPYITLTYCIALQGLFPSRN
jgi:microcystin-dependent protein